MSPRMSDKLRVSDESDDTSQGRKVFNLFTCLQGKALVPLSLVRNGMIDTKEK